MEARARLDRFGMRVTSPDNGATREAVPRPVARTETDFGAAEVRAGVVTEDCPARWSDAEAGDGQGRDRSCEDSFAANMDALVPPTP